MRKNKKIKYYCVRYTANPNVIITVTDTKKEAEEYINKLLYIKNKEHFDNWCFYKNIKDEQKENAWIQYFNTVVPKEDLAMYCITEMYYTKAELAAIVRMFCGCKAIGCSFDLKEEVAYIESKKKMTDMMTQQFMQYLNEELNKADLDEETSTDKEEMVQ